MSRNISYPMANPPPPYSSQPPSRVNSGLDGNVYRDSGSSGGREQSRRQTSGSKANYPSALDSSITRLLVTTKQLLQGLEQWSQCIISENDVSDIYVRLGNGFETCVQAFQRAGIETSELSSIPQDLRTCLEQCLAEEQSKDTLEQYLPNIRAIIYNLLQGLKQKQTQFKRLTNERHREYDSAPSLSSLAEAPPPLIQPQAGSLPPASIPPRRNPSRDFADVDPRLSARSGGSASSANSTSPGQTNASLPPAGQRIPSGSALAERERRAGLPSRPAPPDAFRPARPPPPRRPSSPVQQPPQEGIRDVLTRHQLQDPPVSPAPGAGYEIPTISIDAGSRSSSGTGAGVGGAAVAGARPALSVNTNKPTPPRPDRISRDNFGRPVSRFSMDSEVSAASAGSPVDSNTGSGQWGPSGGAGRGMDPVQEEGGDRSVDSGYKLVRGSRASLDRGRRGSTSSSGHGQGGVSAAPPQLGPAPSLPTLDLPPSISLPSHPSPVNPESLGIPEVTPETRATLAALQRSDPLERRASKRFSSYTFNNLNPSSPRSSPQRPTRRAAVPPMPSLAPAGQLGTETVASGAGSRSGSPIKLGRVREASEEPEEGASGKSRNETPSPTGSVRVLKTPEPSSPSIQHTPRPISGSSARGTTSSPGTIAVYLQIGRKVKRTTLELPITMEALRLVFMERFEYDPGKEDFPEVCIRDHRTGVEYELEEMDDLRDGCVLCLNIEPLDQVKLHIDTNFAALLQEMKEMRTTLDREREQAKRASVLPPLSLAGLSTASAASDHQATPAVAASGAFSPPQPPDAVPTAPAEVQSTPLVVGPTEDHLRQLQEQHDELESLRRELAITRQAHSEYVTETDETLGKLREEAATLRKVSTANPNRNRALLDADKAQLDGQCTETIKAVEDLTDVIDGAKVDAWKRYVTPSKHQMANIRSDLQKARTMVEEFTAAVTKADPSWRKTWQAELHRVMEEQKLHNHQTKLCGDLKKDLDDAEKVLENVQNFVDQRAAGMLSSNVPRVGSAAEDDGNSIPNLLLEIRQKETDPEQRLKAIEAQQRAREREKANKVDDFEAELKGFVGGRKLKKTGGTEEVERMRVRKQEMQLRKLASGDGSVATPGSSGVLSPQSTGTTVAGGSGIAGRMTPQMTGGSVKLTPQLTGASATGRMSPQGTGGAAAAANAAVVAAGQGKVPLPSTPGSAASVGSGSTPEKAEAQEKQEEVVVGEEVEDSLK
ncbi:hypothetical protein IAT38_002575 [Cryptococcus sp. DSM 104549]